MYILYFDRNVDEKIIIIISKTRFSITLAYVDCGNCGKRHPALYTIDREQNIFEN